MVVNKYHSDKESNMAGQTATGRASWSLPHGLQKSMKSSGNEEDAEEVLGALQVLEVDQNYIILEEIRIWKTTSEQVRLQDGRVGHWVHTTLRVHALAWRWGPSPVMNETGVGSGEGISC